MFPFWLVWDNSPLRSEGSLKYFKQQVVSEAALHLQAVPADLFSPRELTVSQAGHGGHRASQRSPWMMETSPWKTSRRLKSFALNLPQFPVTRKKSIGNVLLGSWVNSPGPPSPPPNLPFLHSEEVHPCITRPWKLCINIPNGKSIFCGLTCKLKSILAPN